MFFLPDLIDFEIENIQVSERLVQGTFRSKANTVACPLCLVPARRVQSRYQRTLADLPLSGLRFQLKLLVRRFYCDKLTCVRRIFSERFPNLTKPYAQRTSRLSQTLWQIAMVLGGEAGAALAKKLSMPTSPDTLLRLLTPKNPTATPPVVPPSRLKKVGIDDWSWKKGVNYGTIIVDLDTHKVVDLLADRSTKTVKAWLADHPQIEVISRDRSAEYALAATEGAPQAIQVADRFHIVRNLSEQVELLLARLAKHWKPDLGIAEQLASIPPVLAKELPHPASWKVEPSQQTERKRLAKRAERVVRYQQVVQLRKAGLTQLEIVRRTGLSERTVRKFLKAPTFPETQVSPKRGSIFDRYAAYILEQWQAVLKVNKKGRVTTIRIAPKKEALSINETYTKPSTVWYREISSNKLKQISL